ncbi:MAG TPA: hypothetical protein VFT22_35985 [Kofleriaceae bacterium]|nr:hypothetical protein [Kofleriaceae bacterium]
MSAGQEADLEHAKTTLRGVAVGDALAAEFQTLAPDTSLGAAASRLTASLQHDFPVVDAGRVIGDQLVGLRDLDLVGELLTARGVGNGGLA